MIPQVACEKEEERGKKEGRREEGKREGEGGERWKKRRREGRHGVRDREGRRKRTIHLHLYTRHIGLCWIEK